MILTKEQAVKAIFNIIKDFEEGLPQAVYYYNYLTNYGQRMITETMIEDYFADKGYLD